jgi:hypothetical protein
MRGAQTKETEMTPRYTPLHTLRAVLRAQIVVASPRAYVAALLGTRQVTGGAIIMLPSGR